MKITMPKMPDFSKMTLLDKIRVNCAMREAILQCNSSDCDDCALYSIENYKAWEARQKKETLIKWPISSKERFFVLPVAFVNAMPNKWKKRLLSLLNEYNKKNDGRYWLCCGSQDPKHNDERAKTCIEHKINITHCQYVDIPSLKDIKFRVSATKNGKYVKMPEIFRRR